MHKRKTLTILALAALFCGTAMAVDWDEGVDGDLSDDEFAPTVIVLSGGSNVISGTIGGPSGSSPPDDFFDAFQFVVGAGESVDAVNVLNYVAAGGNPTSGFNVFSPDASGAFVGSTTFGPPNIGDDLLANSGIGPLGPGVYTVGLREGTPGQIYSIDVIFRGTDGACCTDGPLLQSDCIEVPQADCEADGGLFVGGLCADVMDCVALHVELESFTATKTREGIELNWTTSIELDTAGFRVLREDVSRDKAKVRRVVAFFVPAAGVGTSGATYIVVDDQRRVTRGTKYFLQDIDNFGRVTEHGPFTIEGDQPAVPVRTRTRGSVEEVERRVAR